MENFGESKYRASGQKRIVVPVLRRPTGPTASSPSTFSPPSNVIAYSLAVAFHAHLETPRQRVDHGDPDPVQSTREPVAPLRELAARMEPGEDELDTRNPLVGMDVDGHPAAVVADRQRIVPVRDDRELVRLSGDRLVDAVVDDFLRKVIRPGGIGVHARTLAHGVEPRQHLDRGGVVCCVHHRAENTPVNSASFPHLTYASCPRGAPRVRGVGRLPPPSECVHPILTRDPSAGGRRLLLARLPPTQHLAFRHSHEREMLRFIHPASCPTF